MSRYEFAQLHQHKNDWLGRQHIMRARFAADYAKSARRILDIASGSGYCTYHLARMNPQAEVIGADISEDVLEYAQGAYQLPNLRFEHGDAFDMKYPDGFFDLVVTYETLEHVTDGEDIIRELARLTHPEGLLLCSTPNREYNFPTKEHIRLYYPEEFFEMLQRHFNEVERFYQFQTEADYQEVLRRTRKERIQVVTGIPRRLASRLAPRWVKDKIKQALGWKLDEQQLRQYLIFDDEVYPAEAVTAEVQRPGAYPCNLLAVCQGPKKGKC